MQICKRPLVVLIFLFFVVGLVLRLFLFRQHDVDSHSHSSLQITDNVKIWHNDELLFGSLISEEVVGYRQQCNSSALITFIMPTFASRPQVLQAIESIWLVH
jgi:hypothetical protein